MVNVEPIDSGQQSISDDQELAKVLAGIDQQADDSADAGVGTIVPPADDTTMPDPISPAADATDVAAPAEESAVVAEEPELAVPPVVAPVVAEPAVTLPAPAITTAGLSDDLTVVKQDALNELRPLVDKLNVSPEEKFDTYLLLLRSTDDKNLIAPAHEAAKGIADEARRAQALLDIIKEIDFLSQPQQ